MNLPKRQKLALSLGPGMPIVEGVVRPIVAYEPERALEQAWPPLVGFPLEVARDPEGDVFVRVLALEAFEQSGVPVGVADLIAVSWSLDLVTDPRKSAFVFGRIWGSRRAPMVFRVVYEDPPLRLGMGAAKAESGIGASILGGGDGRTKSRLVWELSRVVRVGEAPDRDRWVEHAALVRCIGKPDELSELVGGRG